MNLRQGRVVRTSYGAGPYLIAKVSAPCLCACYFERINKIDQSKAQWHFHISCTGLDGKGDYALNGYRDNGTSVWSEDYLIFDPSREVPRGQTYDLFAEMEAA